MIADHDDILIRKYCFKNQDLTPTSSSILFIKGMQDLQMKNSLILFLTEFIKIGQNCSISVCCVVLGNNFVVAFLNNLVVKESVDISFLMLQCTVTKSMNDTRPYYSANISIQTRSSALIIVESCAIVFHNVSAFLGNLLVYLAVHRNLHSVPSQVTSSFLWRFPTC